MIIKITLASVAWHCNLSYLSTGADSQGFNNDCEFFFFFWLCGLDRFLVALLFLCAILHAVTSVFSGDTCLLVLCSCCRADERPSIFMQCHHLFHAWTNIHMMHFSVPHLSRDSLSQASFHKTGMSYLHYSWFCWWQVSKSHISRVNIDCHDFTGTYLKYFFNTC